MSSSPNSDLDLDMNDVEPSRAASYSTSSSSRTSRTLAEDIVTSNDNNRNRNVRPNLGSTVQINNGNGIYLTKTDFDIENVSLTKSNTPGVHQRKPFNPNSQLISLCDLINNGSQYGTNLILIIISISAVSTNNQTMYQQKSNGVKGGTNTVRHDRNMVVMCPLSPSGNNTAMILFGAGCCERFFERDISLRDNGEIRELKIYLIM